MAKKSSTTARKSSVKSGQPQFAQPALTPDPSKFRTVHASDAAAYKVLDAESKTLQPVAFEASRGDSAEPVLQLQDVLGSAGTGAVKTITQSRQIVFHAVGDTGNTRSVKPQNEVTDKMMADFNESDPTQVPSFLFHLGDVVYNFGESKYYYDQFYEPYRNYPRPILAIAGNHDGMVEPGSTAASLAAFRANFCAESAVPSADAGGLERKTMIQPGA